MMANQVSKRAYLPQFISLLYCLRTICVLRP